MLTNTLLICITQEALAKTRARLAARRKDKSGADGTPATKPTSKSGAKAGQPAPHLDLAAYRRREPAERPRMAALRH
ncbi:MAG: hypothetical protein ACK4FK_02550 [Ferrovibrio sp.]|uniref:hypothetical protein n=1 Tax=Ferrovibrio sp. TaxID=1917215 RepID=UPI00391B5335